MMMREARFLRPRPKRDERHVDQDLIDNNQQRNKTQTGGGVPGPFPCEAVLDRGSVQVLLSGSRIIKMKL